MNSYLQDKDIILRAPDLNDTDIMYKFENQTELWQFGSATGPYSHFALKQYIEQSQNDLFIDRQLRLMIEKNKEAVGIIDVYNFDPFHNRAEIGIVVDDSHRNEGIGKNALHLLSEYCFHRLYIHQLYAYIDEKNEESNSLFNACGFNPCAKLIDWIRADDGAYRTVQMVQKINPYENKT
ncbi:MAG: GNAT family N-acetyltransferase [Phocaeicola sp.]|uniref:GNAT family N-acetyltransferase n=1 Tax=Phocaeicola sp. TaxID=2773926 RepID=UPI003FA17DC3